MVMAEEVFECQECQIKDSLIEALRRQNKYQKMILDQQSQKTRNKYEENQKFFDIIKDRLMKIFVGLPVGFGLTSKEILKEYGIAHPRANLANVIRRVYELKEEGKLWSQPNEQGLVTFYLTLEKLTRKEMGKLEAQTV